MAHQLGAPLPGAPPQQPHQFQSSVHHEMHHHHHQQHGQQSMLEEMIPRDVARVHPWCSVANCTERPLRQYTTASSKQIMFMCKTHFNTVPISTREGWKQYRGTRTFPETKIAVACRPGPNRGHGAVAAAAAAAAAAASDVEPGYTNHPEDERANRGPPKSALWPGKVYNVLYQVWNSHAEQKKISTGDGYMTSSDRAALVPEAANVLREQGHPEMASILDNTTEGARKVIHSRVLAKYLKNREAFSAKLRTLFPLEPSEIQEWEDALAAAQHHADLAPARERETQHQYHHQHHPHHPHHPHHHSLCYSHSGTPQSPAPSPALASAQAQANHPGTQEQDGSAINPTSTATPQSEAAPAASGAGGGEPGGGGEAAIAAATAAAAVTATGAPTTTATTVMGEEGRGAGVGAGRAAEGEPGRPLYNNGGGGGASSGGMSGGGGGGLIGGGMGMGGALIPRKRPGRKPGKMIHKLLYTPEAKRARALDSMVSAAERSNLLQQGAAEAGAEHMRRLELADAERLAMEKEEHALRMAIGKSALALLNKMAGEPPVQQSPPQAPPTPPPQEPGSTG